MRLTVKLGEPLDCVLPAPDKSVITAASWIVGECPDKPSHAGRGDLNASAKKHGSARALRSILNHSENGSVRRHA